MAIDTVDRIYLAIMEAGHSNLAFNEDNGRGYATVRLTAEKDAQLSQHEMAFVLFKQKTPADLYRQWRADHRALTPGVYGFYCWWQAETEELFRARHRAVEERASLKAKIDVINGLAERHYRDTKINWRVGLTDDDFIITQL